VKSVDSSANSKFQASAYKRVLGGRLSANWQSGTTVNGALIGPNGNLHFAAFTTVNVDLFLDVAARIGKVKTPKWLNGVRINIGIDNLQIIIENIYYRGQDLSSTNETPCSISVKPSTNNCIQYRNIYYSLTNLLNDLYLIWSFVTDPKDKVNGIIGDMINSIYLLISFY
jgi:hypothetical protein